MYLGIQMSAVLIIRDAKQAIRLIVVTAETRRMKKPRMNRTANKVTKECHLRESLVISKIEG
jgi:hypothetical protein